MKSLLNEPGYDPNALLDWFIDKLNLKNDAAMARALGIAPPFLSKIRHKKISLGDSVLVRMLLVLDGVHVRDLRKIMGIQR